MSILHFDDGVDEHWSQESCDQNMHIPDMRQCCPLASTGAEYLAIIANVMTKLSQMNFLCELDVNPGDPWHHPWPQVTTETLQNSVLDWFLSLEN